jgi:cell shape-determining protein MreC
MDSSTNEEKLSAILELLQKQEKDIDKLKRDNKKLLDKIEIINKNSEKMANHIDFINRSYDKLANSYFFKNIF